MRSSFQRVLFPTDFSELAQAAFAVARELTNRFEAELHCLYVVDDAYQYWSALGPESVPIGPPPEDLVEMGRQRMAQYATEFLVGLDKPPLTSVVVGRPFPAIIAYSREQDIDLIVMGTHGRGAIAHMLLGSTTEKVVRKAPCPVLTVRAENHEFTMP